MWLGHHFQGQKVSLQGAGHIVAASRTRTACLWLHQLQNASYIMTQWKDDINIPKFETENIYKKSEHNHLSIYNSQWT